MGFPLSNFFGAKSRNAQARKQTTAQNKANKQAYKYNKAVGKDNYKFKVESLAVLKRNNNTNRKHQHRNELSQWRFGEKMRIRKENTEREAYEASIDEAVQQTSFNEMAYNNAQMQQQRSYREQLIGIRFDEEETERSFLAASAGVSLNKKKLAGQANLDTQEEIVQGLKAAGKQRAAGGTGRSASKAIQAQVAESGARQNAIASAFMFAEEGENLKMTGLVDQLIMDRVMLEATRDNVDANDAAMRIKFRQDRLQEDLNAMNSILSEPSALPALPRPERAPKPEYAEIPEWRKPPKPIKLSAPQENLGLALMDDAFGLAKAAVAGGIGGPDPFDFGAAIASYG